MSKEPKVGAVHHREPSAAIVDAPFYYEDRDEWSTDDYYALWRYFNRLAQYVAPTPAELANPHSRSARIQQRRQGVRDRELAEIQVDRMPHAAKYLFKHVLVSSGRYAAAVQRFPNLLPLGEVSRRGTICLSASPTLINEHLTAAGILL